MSGVAAIAFLAAFTSCSKTTDLYDQGAVDERNRQEQEKKDQQTAAKIQETYEEAFENAFGKPNPNHTWGFGNGSANTRALTRAITVNGDTYNKFPSNDDVNSHFPTGIPEGADDLPTKGDYNYYVGNGADHNYVIRSAGTYTIGGGWQNTGYDAELDRWGVPQPYNVYVSVEGDGEVIIKHSGSAMHNLYILKGNVKLDSSVGEMTNVVITVAEGATLTDTRDHIAARTDLYGAIELYNKGTFYATNSTKYDMGNKARFYNSGIATVTGPLTYSPADAENSFFMNLGDGAELTAPSMTLNSTGNFFNSGTVNITGETNVTQRDIYWVNDGHYTTGTITFSAYNATFYNYCNLTVTGHANMYTGEFNLMDNSYTEVGSANLGKNNFRINMGNNAGFNAKGNVRFEKNADNTHQGFFTTGQNAYVRIAGKAEVEAHKYVFVIDGNITYAIKDGIDYVEGLNEYYKPYCEFRNGATEVPADKFAKFNVTPNINSCGATWEYSDYDGRVMAEDLNASQKSDFDFNDVVFDWKIEGNKVKILIKAAGGIYPLYVGDETHEVHAELGKTATDGKYPMINTGAGETGTAEPFYYTFANKETLTVEDIATIPVWVVINGVRADLGFERGKAACKFNTKPSTKWLKEYQDITKGYPDFKDWVNDPDLDWTVNKDESYLYQ